MHASTSHFPAVRVFALWGKAQSCIFPRPPMYIFWSSLRTLLTYTQAKRTILSRRRRRAKDVAHKK